MNSIFQQAIISLEQGNIDKAERQFRIALQELPEQSVQIMAFLSDISLMKDNVHSAIRWQKRSLILSQEMGDIQAEIQISLQLAALYFRKQDYLTAYHWTEEAYKMSEKDWLRHWMAESLAAKARVLSYLGRTGQAIKRSNKSIDPSREAILLLRKSRDIFDEIRNQEGYFRSTLQMGKIFYEEQMLSEARKEFETSLKMLSKDEVLLAASLHLRIAAICRKEKKDIEGIPHALAALGRYKALQKSSKMEEYQEAQDGFGNSMHALGSFYRRIGAEVFWSQLHRILDKQSFTVVESLILDYVHTFVEEIGQEDGPEAEAFSMELQEKLEHQDRTEEIVLKNNHRSLTQNISEQTNTDPKMGQDRNIASYQKREQESATDVPFELDTESPTEMEDMEYTVPRSSMNSQDIPQLEDQIEDHTKISVSQQRHIDDYPKIQSQSTKDDIKTHQDSGNISLKYEDGDQKESPTKHKKHQTKNKKDRKEDRKEDKNHTSLSPQSERTSQVNMVFELDEPVHVSIVDEVTNQGEWKEFSKQKDPTPKWKDFAMIAIGIALGLFLILQVVH